MAPDTARFGQAREIEAIARIQVEHEREQAQDQIRACEDCLLGEGTPLIEPVLCRA